MPDLNADLDQLRDLLEERSIKRGEFVLSSGASSRYYCDTKATTLSPLGSRLVGSVLFGILGDYRAEAVGGLALGSTFIATAVALTSELRGAPMYGFTVREQRKGHGLKRETEESYHPDGQRLLVPGRRVAVVDDVVTGGGSIQKAIQVVRDKECEIVAVAALVDRRAGGGDLLRGQSLPYFSLFEADENGKLHDSEFIGRYRPALTAWAGAR